MREKPFQLRAGHQIGSAFHLREATPDDEADLALGLTRGLYVGRGGVVAVVDSSGAVSRIVSGDAQYHPIQIVRILASGTTASALVALY